MVEYYIYLISSLPMLHFGGNLPFSLENFLGMCAGLIPERDLILLKTILDMDIYFYQEENLVLKKWRAFNIALNNELVKIRAGRKHIDPALYLRPDGYIGYELMHIAMAAHRSPAPIEGEKILDQARWHFLDELSLGHYFDLECLIIYLEKLRILKRWMRINTADKPALLESVLT